MRTLYLIGWMMIATTVYGDSSDHILIGAIRWDAWGGGSVTEQVERTLGPAKYQARAPWFAKVTGPNSVQIDGSPQAVMDREIAWAAEAGIDYWAFLKYPDDNTMSDALKQYLASADRGKVGFCFILHNMLSVKDEAWIGERDRTVTLLQAPEYVKVLGDRPLVYVFKDRPYPAARFTDFQAAAKAAGLHPYYVYMGWNPAQDYAKMAPQGYDAVSAYAYCAYPPTFAELAANCETRYWQAAATAKAPYVPLVTAGWEKAPRKDHPVSWEIGHDYHQKASFTPVPTPEELAAHLGRALDFVEAHPAVCPTRTVICYAWNEYDEGGWLAPTLGADGKPDATRLAAIRAMLDARAARK